MKTLMTILLGIGLMVSPHQMESHLTFFYRENSKAFLEHYFGNFIEEDSEEQTISNETESPLFVTENIKVCSSSSVKTYMSWLKTSATSKQGVFMRTHMTVRDGLLYDKDGFIGVALGSYFGQIGSRYIFTLDTGIVLKLIKVEQKSDNHTNYGCIQKWDKSVIEFVIDLATNKFFIARNGLVAQGNFNNLPQFKGSIVKIEKVLQ